MMKRVIESADPGHALTAQQIPKYALTITFLRFLDLKQVRDADQWSWCRSVVNSYLAHHL